MNTLLRPLYATLTTVARAASAVAPDSSHKLWRSLRARRGLLARWAQHAKVRDPSRPLVWLHAPSVGEGLQARPVAQALRAAHPELQLAYSFFSPSAERFAASVGADCTDYLPFDDADDADHLLELLQPQLLVFVKLDVWPVLVERAVARGVPVAMLSATVAERSGRRGRLSSALLRDAYRALSLVGAIDDVNGERLVELGVRRERLRVTGDTRFDQVWHRAHTVNRLALHMAATQSDRPTLVAGSTWPADEAVLLPAWRAVQRAMPTARLVVAPHEPTPAHVEPLIAWAREAGLRVATLSELERGFESVANASAADVIVVDRTGVLGDLYAHATAAFVGGGFHRAGLHSVIEPAAYGVPVLFGPGHHMSREAGLLLACGGAKVVTTLDNAATVMLEWLRDAATRRSAGAAAVAVVQRELGATERSVSLVRELVPTLATASSLAD